MSLRHIRALTAQERAALAELYKTSRAVELVHRSHAILLSADGWRVSKIAELLRVDEATVHRWLRAGVTHDHFFGSLDAAVAAAQHFLAKVAEQPAAVLSRIGRTVAPLEQTLAATT